MVHFRFPIHQLPSALQDFASEMETIVDKVLNKNDCNSESGAKPDSKGYTPAVDIYETDTQYSLYMDLPGVAAESVKIAMQDERLVVNGTRVGLSIMEGVSIHRHERTTGAFSRSIRLPKQLDADKIEAHFDNGVLHVLLPKQVKAEPRTIEIKTGRAS